MKAMFISSDGHATARMRDYRPYLETRHHDEFDAFCAEYEQFGSRNFERPALSTRLDPEAIDAWIETMVTPGRVDGDWDPTRRLHELEHEGVVAEILFPENSALPFQLSSPLLTAVRKGTDRNAEQIQTANRAYNRWLADFCSAAPARFGGLACVAFDDIEKAVEEIRWAKQAGLRGVLLPSFPSDMPVFHSRFEPIWSALEELDMPANSHTGLSSIGAVPPLPTLPHPAIASPFLVPQMYFMTHQLLHHFIWGGVFERHPNLRVAFTEQGSGWVIDALISMDYSYEGSYLRRDIRTLVPRPPSEYFARQCLLGSSLFSRAEIAARHDIGLDKIMLGADYPHHEGTWTVGTLEYLQRTLGAEQVPVDEAAKMLGGNAAKAWGFDPGALAPVVERVGFDYDELLATPTDGKILRGDINRPLGAGIV